MLQNSDPGAHHAIFAAAGVALFSNTYMKSAAISAAVIAGLEGGPLEIKSMVSICEYFLTNSERDDNDAKEHMKIARTAQINFSAAILPQISAYRIANEKFFTDYIGVSAPRLLVLIDIIATVAQTWRKRNLDGMAAVNFNALVLKYQKDPASVIEKFVAPSRRAQESAFSPAAYRKGQIQNQNLYSSGQQNQNPYNKQLPTYKHGQNQRTQCLACRSVSHTEETCFAKTKLATWQCSICKGVGRIQALPDFAQRGPQIGHCKAGDLPRGKARLLAGGPAPQGWPGPQGWPLGRGAGGEAARDHFKRTADGEVVAVGSGGDFYSSASCAGDEAADTFDLDMSPSDPKPRSPSISAFAALDPITSKHQSCTRVSVLESCATAAELTDPSTQIGLIYGKHATVEIPNSLHVPDTERPLINFSDLHNTGSISLRRDHCSIHLPEGTLVLRRIIGETTLPIAIRQAPSTLLRKPWHREPEPTSQSSSIAHESIQTHPIHPNPSIPIRFHPIPLDKKTRTAAYL
ncbi:hypothetical protein T492DRAFT_1130457 [Pavlovales sp. CCMP2436]|nr:hypothetical protein T492DRAFT_1130457 [Pavlovales sp. CCMP2436]